jgi:hypothetical protein
MIAELDIWRAANLLIFQHGPDAELEAAKRADLMLDRVDSEGRHVWAWIRLAIEALQARQMQQTELIVGPRLQKVWAAPFPCIRSPSGRSGNLV